MDYEKLGVFYLGRGLDPDGEGRPGEPLLYDSRDLTTHAVCVGMTGSGKTGLCLSLLEEAALDAVPAIAIDPKGDLSNLLLTFPKLLPEDFRPWIDPAEAARKGLDPAAHAAGVARAWREGLAAWGQGPDRIERFRDSADIAIYTPGSRAGLPISVLGSLRAPAGLEGEALEERIASVTSGILTLLGISGDPLASREHILVAHLIGSAWQEGRDLDLAALIAGVQSPPFPTLGALDVESFFPAPARSELALRLNHLLASPGFSAWREGEPLEIQRLLWTPAGKPRISIFSIAHLSDHERMFFVTLLLQEFLAWMRSQPGTGSLRALLYMDEVFGFFPPTANPPAKKPMLTLLKQARAYGVGVVLTTQNPVDLDYKGLANAGTWFLGRLQTERDKARVIDGLEGAATAAGSRFDRARMDTMLSGLGNRVFLLHNVHDETPRLFQTRWCLSYLRGPMTREEIARLMESRKSRPPEPEAAVAEAVPHAATEVPAAEAPPAAPPGVRTLFLRAAGPAGGSAAVYRPALAGTVTLHFVSAKHGIDQWKDETVLAPLVGEAETDLWEGSSALVEGAVLVDGPPAGARFTPLPPAARNAKRYATWAKQLASYAYRERPLVLLECAELRAVSRPGESEGDFRTRLVQQSREMRDGAVDKLAARYQARIAALDERIRKAEARVDRERSQYQDAKTQAAVSLGATVLGALLGRRAIGAGTVGRASTTARGASRAARQRQDIVEAQASVEALLAQRAGLEAELRRELEPVEAPVRAEAFTLREVRIAPRKSDLGTPEVNLVWIPG